VFTNFQMDQTFADGVSHGSAKHEGSDEIPECCPQDGPEWSQYPSRNHRCNGVSRIVPPIGKFKRQRQKHCENCEGKWAHSVAAKKRYRISFPRHVPSQSTSHLYRAVILQILNASNDPIRSILKIQFGPRVQVEPKHISSYPRPSVLHPNANDVFQAD
jgi:hypothetical protein